MKKLISLVMFLQGLGTNVLANDFKIDDVLVSYTADDQVCLDITTPNKDISADFTALLESKVWINGKAVEFDKEKMIPRTLYNTTRAAYNLQKDEFSSYSTIFDICFDPRPIGIHAETKNLELKIAFGKKSSTYNLGENVIFKDQRLVRENSITLPTLKFKLSKPLKKDFEVKIKAFNAESDRTIAIMSFSQFKHELTKRNLKVPIDYTSLAFIGPKGDLIAPIEIDSLPLKSKKTILIELKE